MDELCSVPMSGDEACARPQGHDGDCDPQFNADEWPEPECPKCANPIPGMPAHEPSRKCHYRPHYVAHCSCSACY